jgi:S-adenosylmethionine:tRNA ribosyltransferase-isomerase
MNIKEFSYDLPDELIASYPTKKRSDSRLLCIKIPEALIDHRKFFEIVDYLREGDLLVFNDTRVIPARFYGEKETGGKFEVLLERILVANQLLVQIKSSKPPRKNSRLRFYRKGTEEIDESLCVSVLDREEGFFRLQVDPEIDLTEKFFIHGHVPLPPYIKRSDEHGDQDRYQTVYAQQDGAVAAPTAGLHFDGLLLSKIAKKNVDSVFLTLHVGAGTFQPFRVNKIEDHVMHEERMVINEEVCSKINACKKRGGRVVAVGTTSVRALESSAVDGVIYPKDAETDIFIFPGFEFQIVDAMITNFHLPESTLLMLVSAFSGKKNILDAYQEAIDKKYRFFSYGDAMLIY